MQTATSSFPAKIAAIFQAVRQYFAMDHEVIARAFAEGYEAGPHAINPHRRWSMAHLRWQLGNKSGCGN
jgi:hypothetical protein